MYTIAEQPSNPSDAFEVLNSVFGGSSFSEEDALLALYNADIAESTFWALLRQGIVNEVEADT